MSETAISTDRRAQKVALFGFFLQFIACVALWALGYVAQSDAILVAARLTTVGIPIWLTLFLVFTQMRRVAAEALETEELKHTRTSAEGDPLFELDDEALLLEQNRLRWMIRWILPGTTILVSAILLLGQFIGWSWSFDSAFEEQVIKRTLHPTMMMWFIVGIGLLCYLYAAYAKALAKIPHWRVIRAGATIMSGNAIFCLVLAIGLMASPTIDWAEPVVAYVFRAFLLILGIEFALNFVLDLYRPRASGEISRPSFDSRLLGLLTEPGGIAKSLAEAVNYQFGFEVSKTWFYELLQRWFLPIVALTCIAIFLLTSIVIVGPDERVVVERFGRRVGGDDHSYGPGLFFKWPYPVDVVYRAPVRRIDELIIGEATDEREEDEAIIWTETHEYVPELMLLVASEREVIGDDKMERSGGGAEDTESVPVSLLMVSVPIEYRIKDIHEYLYKYTNPERLLESVAYQFLSDYASSVDIRELMGPGRKTFNAEFQARLQERIDQLGAGLEIVFTGVLSAHPPAKEEVAKTFQYVIQAEIQQAADVNRASGMAKRVLVDVAGTDVRVRELDEAIKEQNQFKVSDEAGAKQLLSAESRVNTLLFGDVATGVAPPGGAIAEMIANARANASKRISDASTKVRAFATEVAAYEAAPELYIQRKQLEIYENLGSIRRYLIAGDPSNVIITYSTEREAALDKVLAEDLGNEGS